MHTDFEFPIITTALVSLMPPTTVSMLIHWRMILALINCIPLHLIVNLICSEHDVTVICRLSSTSSNERNIPVVDVHNESVSEESKMDTAVNSDLYSFHQTLLNLE